MLKKSLIVLVQVAVTLLCVGCQAVDGGQGIGAGGPQDLRLRIREAAGAQALQLAAWEIGNLLSFEGEAVMQDSAGNDFSSLSQNISAVLTAENITVFPQVRVKITAPPLLLVVSPRDRIVYYDRVLLSPGLPSGEIAAIEERVDALDMSSLVVELGGFGAAYPSIISPDMPPANAVNAAVEEWAHQYLAFKPLGFLYLLDSLGLRQDPDVIVMNETLAGMIAQEAGSRVFKLYYPDLQGRPGNTGPAAFDFNGEMRETRLKVDELLAAGRVDEAGRYMQDRQKEFNSNGYAIRKLNQAYFAFHGIYGQDPGAVSPVYQDMLELRRNCANLAEFVDKVSAMTAYKDLERSHGSPAN